MIFCYVGVGFILLVLQPGTEGVSGCVNEPMLTWRNHNVMQVHMTTITVEIEIFSGMPNPEWTLSEASAAMFLSKLSGLQKTTERPRSTNLGYRGLVARMSQEAGLQMYIQNGLIESSDGTSSTFFLDSQRSLERWLIGTGRKSLSHEILEVIDADLQK
jgi:hypothetical protein